MHSQALNLKTLIINLPNICKISNNFILEISLLHYLFSNYDLLFSEKIYLKKRRTKKFSTGPKSAPVSNTALICGEEPPNILLLA